MKSFLWILTLAAITLPVSLADASRKPGPMIVMIDTGSTASFHKKMIMDANCDVCWNIHGTQMARSLENELELLNTKPIRVTQLVWETSDQEVSQVYAAINLEPKILSMSLSGSEPIEKERRALERASKANLLILVAAGNEGWDHPGYPGSYRLPCLVAVSSKYHGRIAQWSGGANAGDIYIEARTNEAGTSYSTARAAGIAAQYYQKHPNATCQEAKAFLIRKFGSIQPPLK